MFQCIEISVEATLGVQSVGKQDKHVFRNGKPNIFTFCLTTIQRNLEMENYLSPTILP